MFQEIRRSSSILFEKLKLDKTKNFDLLKTLTDPIRSKESNRGIPGRHHLQKLPKLSKLNSMMINSAEIRFALR